MVVKYNIITFIKQIKSHQPCISRDRTALVVQDYNTNCWLKILKNVKAKSFCKSLKRVQNKYAILNNYKIQGTFITKAEYQKRQYYIQ